MENMQNTLNTYVEVIPATKSPLTGKALKRKLNVAPYCRVSTDEEEQMGSYQNQVDYYTNLVNSNPEWNLVEVFGDEGISGTSASRRSDFKRMMKMCDEGKIDLIITKSISRFSRNTVETLKYARALKEKGIGIIFEKENINTLTCTSELLLSIYSSFAQGESESLSRNVKMGRRFKYSQGKVCFNFNRLYGYSQDRDGNITIIEEQAKAVRLIYKLFKEGKSLREITDILAEEKIPSPNGKDTWKIEAVKRILTNEKYSGDVMTQKTYIDNPITKKSKKNTGTFPKYLVRNHHIAIIPRELFDEVQIELGRRSCIKKNESRSEYGKYSGKFPYNNIMICAECGSVYRRTMWVTRQKEKKYVWRCSNRLENGTRFCKHSPTIDEECIDREALRVVNSYLADGEIIKEYMKSGIASVLCGDDIPSRQMENSNRIGVLNEQMREALNRSVAGEISAEELEAECMEIMAEQKKLRQDNMELENERRIKSADQSQLKEVLRCIDNLTPGFTEMTTEISRQLIDKIEIMSKERMVIWAKCGIPHEVKLA